MMKIQNKFLHRYSQNIKENIKYKNNEGSGTLSISIVPIDIQAINFQPSWKSANFPELLISSLISGKNMWAHFLTLNGYGP